MTDAAFASLGRVDTFDAVAVDVAADATAVQITEAALRATPRWVTGLLSVRDVLVAPLGLHGRTPVPNRHIVRIEPGRRLGPFVVFSVDDGEVLLGDDDRHLAFRVSFAVRPTGRGREAVCTTTVRYNNLFGHVYFVMIRPFHHLVVRALLNAAAQQLTPPADQLRHL